MKSLKIDIVMPWEYGLIIFLLGLTLIIYGVKQGKNKDDDFTKIPLIKPTTKIIFGTFLIIFGSIQLLPLLKNL
jgi:putative Mn2+ efflux pump MntP